ncbi:hypothetical protein llap_5412 [Limosa lapponica baueri]|uniref:Uncharacterized protein n=1 Tax=Limosa lapponica baueri TaxID=1758121 RepID=A0A2I0UE09_LIMLA|nr:hypothetical protein llap_5412 [Limosa lapponica baueri]
MAAGHTTAGPTMLPVLLVHPGGIDKLVALGAKKSELASCDTRCKSELEAMLAFGFHMLYALLGQMKDDQSPGPSLRPAHFVQNVEWYRHASSQSLLWVTPGACSRAWWAQQTCIEEKCCCSLDVCFTPGPDVSLPNVKLITVIQPNPSAFGVCPGHVSDIQERWCSTVPTGMAGTPPSFSRLCKGCSASWEPGSHQGSSPQSSILQTLVVNQGARVFDRGGLCHAN